MIRQRSSRSVRLSAVFVPRSVVVVAVVAIAGTLLPADVNAADTAENTAQARFLELTPWLPKGLPRVDEVVAFEENAHFVYLAGRLSASEEPATGGRGRSRIRFVLLRPATLVVDVWPYRPKDHVADKPATISVVNVPSRSGKASQRAVCVYRSPQRQTEPKTELRPAAGGGCHVTIRTRDRRFYLALPLQLGEPGRIAVESSDGKPILPKRRLPAGLLPVGPEGMRLIEGWDSRYRSSSRPSWDKGFPSTHLRAAVEGGVVEPGRAIVLGCGTGTNAVYLAKQGFDVTALDIAPTALNLAEEKASKAGVKARWLLADVLAPPSDLQPFDFIFDRGCYHGVRRADARGYAKTLTRLSKPGTQVLILAGNANEERHYGPPRVKEEELRGDFASRFEFVWLKTVRFDAVDPQEQGALAWSALLRRKADDGP